MEVGFVWAVEGNQLVSEKFCAIFRSFTQIKHKQKYPRGYWVWNLHLMQSVIAHFNTTQCRKWNILLHKSNYNAESHNKMWTQFQVVMQWDSYIPKLINFCAMLLRKINYYPVENDRSNNRTKIDYYPVENERSNNRTKIITL
jgi:hypothetical protein